MKSNAEFGISNSTLRESLISTVYISLFIQTITGVIDLYVAAFSHINNKGDEFLKKLLWLEIIVQFIEGTFYIWLARHSHTISNITPNRYFDWMFSTPTMLFTLISYLIYLKTPPNDLPTIYQLFQDNASNILSILGLNASMLIFGYLGEINVISEVMAVFFGFIPFIIYFAMIYFNYAVHSETGQQLFWYFSSIWFLYGVAALSPYYIKNISYNILDIFAKNFFGLFLAYVLVF
jgi:hypothetical protein